MLSTKSPFTEHNVGWLAIHSHIFLYINTCKSYFELSLFITSSKQRTGMFQRGNTFSILKDLIFLFPDTVQLNCLGLLHSALSIMYSFYTLCRLHSVNTLKY